MIDYSKIKTVRDLPTDAELSENNTDFMVITNSQDIDATLDFAPEYLEYCDRDEIGLLCRFTIDGELEALFYCESNIAYLNKQLTRIA